jgi:hypothetical protein
LVAFVFWPVVAATAPLKAILWAKLSFEGVCVSETVSWIWRVVLPPLPLKVTVELYVVPGASELALALIETLRLPEFCPLAGDTVTQFWSAPAVQFSVPPPVLLTA